MKECGGRDAGIGPEVTAGRYAHESMVSALTTELKQVGLAEGLDVIGVTGVEPFASTAVEIQRRKSRGTSGRLRFTLADPRSTDVSRSVPNAQSLVVGGRSYVPEVGPPPADDDAVGHVARFAVGDRYAPLRTALSAIAARLHDAGHEAEVLIDDNRLVDRAAAVRAGVAWWGKSTMAIAPKYGPWLLLGTVVTTAELDADQPMMRDCGTCDSCIPACPTGALDEIGRLDATKCIAYWLQTPGVIPVTLRKPIGQRIYGCDECLVACPPGQKIAKTGEADVTPSVDLLSVLTGDDADLLASYGHFYIPRRNPAYLRRNALVAAANHGDPAILPAVLALLTHPLSDVRAHAVAAAHALGADFESPPLSRARGSEQHPDVLAEYHRAHPRSDHGR